MGFYNIRAESANESRKYDDNNFPKLLSILSKMGLFRE